MLNKIAVTITMIDLVNGLLFYKNRVFIPDLPQLCQNIIHEYHATPSAGHSGVKATLSWLGPSF